MNQRSLGSFFLIAAQIFLLCQSGFAQTQPSTPKTTGSVTINATNLWTYLTQGNTNIIQEANNVHLAKDQIASAKGKLLPSLNFNLLNSGPNFAVSAISFLVPFLIPSNWGNYKIAKYQAMAEQYGFRILEANTYASEYTMLFSVLNDIQGLEILKQNADGLKKVYDLVARKKQIGLENEADARYAKAEWEKALDQCDETAKSIAAEKAALKHALGFTSQQTDIQINIQHVSPSELENLTADQAVEKIIPLEDNVPTRSLEAAQLVYLVLAAKKNKMNAKWAFVGGSSIGFPQSSNGTLPSSTLSFSKMILGGSFNFGFDYFPNIHIAQRNVDQINIRETENRLELAEVLGSALERLRIGIGEALRDQVAASDMKYTYDSTLQMYKDGRTTLDVVMQKLPDYLNAQLAAIAAQTYIDVTRITLHRSMLTDQFTNLPPPVFPATKNSNKDKNEPQNLPKI